jgi:hypothetical protein
VPTSQIATVSHPVETVIAAGDDAAEVELAANEATAFRAMQSAYSTRNPG